MFLITVSTILDDGAVHREYHLRSESETAADLAWCEVRALPERRSATITELAANRARACAQGEAGA